MNLLVVDSLVWGSLVWATFAETFKTVIGVLLALSGLGILLMGVIALSDKSFQRVGLAAILGVVLLVGGLFLVGAL